MIKNLIRSEKLSSRLCVNVTFRKNNVINNNLIHKRLLFAVSGNVSDLKFRKKTVCGNNRTFKRTLFFSVPDLIQNYVSGLHGLIGTPWWATIAISTVFVRTGLFPIVRFQYIHLDKLAG